MTPATVDLLPDVCKHGATRAGYIAVIDRALAVWVRTREAHIRTHADEAVFELTERIDLALEARSKLTRNEDRR